MDVVELYPADLLNEIQDPSESDLEAIKALSPYLSRERSRLLQYKRTLFSDGRQYSHDRIKHTKRVVEGPLADENVTPRPDADYEYLIEFVETTLLQSYVLLRNPLLQSLLRVKNSCNFKKTVSLLLKHGLNRELIDFYRTMEHHEEALEFLY